MAIEPPTFIDLARSQNPGPRPNSGWSKARSTGRSYTPTPTPSPTRTPTPTPTNTPTNTPTQSNTPTPSPTVSNTPTNTPTNTVTPTVTPSNTPTPTNTPPVTPSNTPTQTITPSVTPTNTPTNTVTNTPTPSITPSNTPPNTPTVTPSITPTNTPTPSNTPPPTVTPTPSNTPTNTPTPTITPSVTPTLTPTPTEIPDAFTNGSGFSYVSWDSANDQFIISPDVGGSTHTIVNASDGSKAFAFNSDGSGNNGNFTGATKYIPELSQYWICRASTINNQGSLQAYDSTGTVQQFLCASAPYEATFDMAYFPSIDHIVSTNVDNGGWGVNVIRRSDYGNLGDFNFTVPTTISGAFLLAARTANNTFGLFWRESANQWYGRWISAHPAGASFYTTLCTIAFPHGTNAPGGGIMYDATEDRYVTYIRQNDIRIYNATNYALISSIQDAPIGDVYNSAGTPPEFGLDETKKIMGIPYDPNGTSTLGHTWLNYDLETRPQSAVNIISDPTTGTRVARGITYSPTSDTWCATIDGNSIQGYIIYQVDSNLTVTTLTAVTAAA